MAAVKPRWTYRDRRHWSFDWGRLGIYRWCSGAPCHLPGVAQTRHPVEFAWEGP